MSAWTDHVKKVSKEKGISYKDALKVASKTYKKQPKSEPKAGQPSKTMPGEEDFTTKRGKERKTSRRAFEK